jgi:hypothetical protein
MQWPENDDGAVANKTREPKLLLYQHYTPGSWRTIKMQTKTSPTQLLCTLQLRRVPWGNRQDGRLSVCHYLRVNVWLRKRSGIC